MRTYSHSRSLFVLKPIRLARGWYCLKFICSTRKDSIIGDLEFSEQGVANSAVLKVGSLFTMIAILQI